jgi:lysozyme
MRYFAITRPLLIAVALTACGRNHGGRYGSVTEALTVCPASTTVPGIDVSHYDGTIDWSQVAGAGIKFAYAKASEGTTVTDDQFAANWSGMIANGVLRGAYHFFRASTDGTAQADFFLSQTGTLGQAGDLPPVLDWELDDGQSSATNVAQAQAFIDEIKAKTGLPTIIYTDSGFWTGLTGTSQFSAETLWVANWTGSLSSCPDVPTPWSNWVVWQWNDTGTVAGVPDSPDVDVFNGTLAQLQQLGGMTTTTPTFTPPAQASGNLAITLVNYPDEHMNIFARTPGGVILESATTGTGDTWSQTTSLGSGALCGSAAAFWGGSWLYPELFSPLSEGGTVDIVGGSSGWGTFQSFGTSDLVQLTTAITSDGRAEVFGLGPDGAIWQKAWNSTTGAWSGWVSLGGSFVTGAGAVTWGNGTVEIFATDSSGAVWHAWSDSSGSANWATFAQLGGPAMATQPVGVRWNDGMDGHAEVYARGTDDQLYHSDFSYTDGWPELSVLNAGTTIAGQPSAIMNPTTAGPEVFARSPDGTVLRTAWNGTHYSAFAPIGSQTVASDPFGWTRGDGTTELFAIDATGRLIHATEDSTDAWGAWSSIGSGFDSCTGTASAPDGGTGQADAGTAFDAGPSTRPDGGEGQATPDAGTTRAVRDAGATFAVPDAGDGVAASGCGCAAGGMSGSMLWVLGLARLRRRRDSAK